MLDGLAAELLEVRGGGVGLEQRVIDEPGHAGRHRPRRLESEPRGAGVDDALQPDRTAVVDGAVTRAARPRTRGRGDHLLGDQGDEPGEIDRPRVHQNASLSPGALAKDDSSRRIFRSRRR